MATPIQIGPIPASLKPIAHLLKTATEHETRDPVVTYWCRMAAMQSGMKKDKGSKEALGVLLPLMDWMEKEKKVLGDNEAISSEVVAAAHIENYAIKLFTWADREDRAGKFGKNVVKAFYSAGMLFDAMEAAFGDLTPENAHMRKYAKWKAAYIHNCLKNGQTPVPGPVAGEEGDEEAAGGAVGGWADPAGQAPPPPSDLEPHIPPPSSIAPTQPPPSVAPTPQPRASVALPPINPAQLPPVAQPYAAPAPAAAGGSLTPAQVQKTQKFCKYASSALDYDDKATAIDNLRKALRLLETGQE